MSRVHDPRMLQRRHSEGDLRQLRDAADKSKSLHPAKLVSQPKVPGTSPFELPLDGQFKYQADRARAYAAQTLAVSKDKLPPLRVAPESALLFKAAPPNVAFCGVVSLKDKTAYLCPLVPQKGSAEFPAEKVQKLSVAHNIPATPILHTDIAVRQATGTGEASHDQLAKRVGVADDCIGFTIWKGDHGDAVNFSFTSRSQNTSKFGRSATAAEVAAEAAKNEEARQKAKAAKKDYDLAKAEFDAKRAEHHRAFEQSKLVWQQNGRVGPPPPPPPQPVEPSPAQFGYSLQKTNEANLTELQKTRGKAKGVNPAGIVSLPYAVAVLDTLQSHFNSGLATSAEAPT